MSETQSKFEEAVRTYFGQQGFHRFLVELRARLESSSSGPRGYVALHRPTEEEFEVLDGFYGTYTSDRSQSDYRYSILRFERLLRSSRFQLSVPELLGLLSGRQVRTRGERRAAAAGAWETMIREAVEEVYVSRFQASNMNAKEADGIENELIARGRQIAKWVEGMQDETSPGVRILRKLFAAGPKEAGRALLNTVRALLALAEMQVKAGPAPDWEQIRLPVLSAQATGDAHALDWKHPQGRLFWWGLVASAGVHSREGGFAAFSDIDSDEDSLVKERAVPSFSQAQLIREGYRRGGVADDDLSSQVMFFAPGWDSLWEERILTLRQVERMTGTPAGRLNSTAVYAVENPSVFAMLADAAAKQYQRSGLRGQSPDRTGKNLPLLVCVSGQPSVAVVKLLEFVLGGVRKDAPLLLYSGDIDVKGLEIALGLQQRFPQRYRPWKMDSEHYTRYAHRGIPLTEAERQRLEDFEAPWEPKLGSLMSAEGFKLHQELWVNELLADWLDAFDEAATCREGE
ncbi:TIGR02679 domain-containing protein [Cohnella cellulosilytica]|uniref:TIGR02679 domain-containing protein n=1 Tax=Cohnella cellulosilytica TaxID=986710 RepID=A0ABW2F9K8_9BACL